MAVISTYPNVPLVTTNVATDSIRQDNQHKPEIPETHATTEPHAEREINPEKDQRQQQESSKDEPDASVEQTLDEQERNESDSRKEHLNSAVESHFLLQHKAALSRKDIKVKGQGDEDVNSQQKAQVTRKIHPHQVQQVYEPETEMPSENQFNLWG